MTTFADPRLELAVRAALPQEVLAQPLSALTKLRAVGRGIRRLGGIAALSELRFVDLSDNPIASLVELGATTKLILLELRGIAAASLTGLDGLPDLEGLDLAGSELVDIDALAGAPALRSLELARTPVTKLGALSTLTKLESLSLGGHLAQRDGLGLTPLEGLAGLRQLRLYGLHIESADLFDEFVNLEELVLEQCTFGDDLRALRRLPRLEYLSLQGCAGVDLAVLEGQERLSCLVLDDAKLGSLAPLLRLDSLEQLSLEGASYEDGLEQLGKHTKLRELRVNNELV